MTVDQLGDHLKQHWPAIRELLLGSQMHTSNRSACHPCFNRVSATSRTAVYGSVRTVVWEGRSREAPPYPDRSDFVQWPFGDVASQWLNVSFRSQKRLLPRDNACFK